MLFSKFLSVGVEEYIVRKGLLALVIETWQCVLSPWRHNAVRKSRETAIHLETIGKEKCIGIANIGGCMCNWNK